MRWTFCLIGLSVDTKGRLWPRAIKAIIQWLESRGWPTHIKQEDLGVTIALSVRIDFFMICFVRTYPDDPQTTTRQLASFSFR